jgi:hypothetical protein
MVLIGAIVSYCEVNWYLFVVICDLKFLTISLKKKVIPMYFKPNYWTCTTAQIFQLIGFLLAYGALVLKTWRFKF